MSAPTRPDGALASPTPTQQVCVYDVHGVPLPRVTDGHAEMLCSRGWARWAGHGTKRHLKMTVEVPQCPRGGRGDGTQPVRADPSCRRFGTGQLMGNPDFIREFIPTHN